MRRVSAPITVLIVLLLAPATLRAQDPDMSEQRRAAMEARRDSLETQIVQRLIGRLTRELELNAEQRTQTERILIQSGEQRRVLNRETVVLRTQIHRASRTATTTDDEFTRLLTNFEALRVREHELWRRDQEQLAAVLSPRQRAQFLISWARFQDDVRDILSRRMREDVQHREDSLRERTRGGRRDHDGGPRLMPRDGAARFDHADPPAPLRALP